MFKNIKIEQYKKELKKLYEEEKEWFYTDNFKESGFVKRGALSDFLYAYHNGEFSENAFMLGFDSLACYSIDRAIYYLIEKNNKEQFFDHFSLYAYYSYLTIHESSKTCKCLQSATYLEMRRVTNYFASNIIAREWNKVELMGKDLINSLNAKGCIIRRGDAKALQSWFLIELFSKSFNVEIDKKRAFYPKEFYPYDMVLKNWDTTDLNEVDKYIYTLCDTHLETTGRNSKERELYLEIPIFLLFPFEVLSWLRFREKQGLENPNEFSHPLMNELTVKTLFENKTQIPEPNEIPFLNEFLEPIYKHCPDIQKNEKFFLKNIIPTALKSTNYQAVLPKGHPQEKKLKESPFAYSYYEKGTPFSYENLEEFDISLIKWIEKEK